MSVILILFIVFKIPIVREKYSSIIGKNNLRNNRMVRSLSGSHGPPITYPSKYHIRKRYDRDHNNYPRRLPSPNYRYRYGGGDSGIGYFYNYHPWYYPYYWTPIPLLFADENGIKIEKEEKVEVEAEVEAEAEVEKSEKKRNN